VETHLFSRRPGRRLLARSRRVNPPPLAGDPERGIVLLRRAIHLRPGNATWHAHLSSLCRTTYRMRYRKDNRDVSAAAPGPEVNHLFVVVKERVESHAAAAGAQGRSR
jgi:hypothetical protein